MVIFGAPKDKENFICADKKLTKHLHKLGFQPIYRDIKNIYFTKNKEIEKAVRNWNLQTK